MIQLVRKSVARHSKPRARRHNICRRIVLHISSNYISAAGKLPDRFILMMDTRIMRIFKELRMEPRQQTRRHIRSEERWARLLNAVEEFKTLLLYAKH